jgi:hypothetical protein
MASVTGTQLLKGQGSWLLHFLISDRTDAKRCNVDTRAQYELRLHGCTDTLAGMAWWHRKRHGGGHKWKQQNIKGKESQEQRKSEAGKGGKKRKYIKWKYSESKYKGTGKQKKKMKKWTRETRLCREPPFWLTHTGTEAMPAANRFL